MGGGCKRKEKNYQLGDSINELAAKSLNPTTRINWACPKSTLTVPLKKRQFCFISTQTPKTVIILTEPGAPSGSLRSVNHRTVPKRHSLFVRNTYTPENETSPSRKFSLSGWETFDEE
jgi:hypothetical protein